MFTYKNNQLFAEECNVSEIAHAVGTPFYCYSHAHFAAQYNEYATAFAGVAHKICYAMKANSNQAVIKSFASFGAGVDVVSIGELKRALKAGVEPKKIVFSGVAKKDKELSYALQNGIFCINCESEPEAEALSKVAVSLNKTATISFRINPDVDAKTHAKISTGKSENKFGIPLSSAREVYARVAKLPNISLTGIDMHIGSQLTDLQPYDDAFTLLAELVVDLRADGHSIHHVDVGGGVGIPYKPRQKMFAIAEYAAIVLKHLGALNVEILFEPGRFMVGNGGILVTEVVFVKESEGRTFTIVDAAMNDIIRPTLYEAYHTIKPVIDMKRATKKQDVVGPVCETGDYLALNRTLPLMQRGELLAVFSAGAYGAVQAGTYNTRALIPEVLVKGDKFALIREREDEDTLIDKDIVPNWV